MFPDDSINQSHSEANMNNEPLKVDNSTMQAHSKIVSDSDGMLLKINIIN